MITRATVSSLSITNERSGWRESFEVSVSKGRAGLRSWRGRSLLWGAVPLRKVLGSKPSTGLHLDLDWGAEGRAHVNF